MFHRLLGSELIPWKYIRIEQCIGLVGVSLIIFLTLCVYLGAKCIHSQVISSSSDIQIQAFWKPGLSENDVRNTWQQAKHIPGVHRVATYTSAQALEYMHETLGSDLDLSWMTEHNPLPPTAVLYAEISDAHPASEILAEVDDLPGVEKVHSNPMQVQAAEIWTTMASTVVWPLIIVLLITQAVLLANTVRMSMTKLQADIHVLRLVGATRRAYLSPILSRMILLTLGGTALALIGAKVLQVRANHILSAPPFHLGCPFVSWPELLATLFGACLVTGLSCALAIHWQDDL